MKNVVATLFAGALLLGSVASLADATKPDSMKEEDAASREAMKHDGMPRVTPAPDAAKKAPMRKAGKDAMKGGGMKHDAMPDAAMAGEPAMKDAMGTDPLKK